MNIAENMLHTKTLNQLLEGIAEVSRELSSAADVRVSGLQLDSRLIKPGDLFFASFGRNHDARDYIDFAIERGAVAVLAHAGGQWQVSSVRNGVPVLVIADLSARAGEIASRFYGEPSAAMTMIGVTGTNGKTSCTQFIAQALNGLGRRCGVIGTLGIGVPPVLAESSYTTPDPIQVHSALADLRLDGADSVAMEVSSQGLHQYRVNGVQFDIAVFTNLTRDHLDYHGSMEEYAQTKLKLFMFESLTSAVVNIDDPFASQVLNSLSPHVKSYTYSVQNTQADVYAQKLELNRQGFKAKVHTPFGVGQLQGALLGTFNFSNVMAVLTCLLASESARDDFDIDALFAQLGQVKSVSGRMEMIGDESSDITVVVDYAHTPDALRVALMALREHFAGRIWCVFGCGGNRDQGKRPLMAEMAEQYADVLVVTDDNPRKENADEIVRQIVLGITDTTKLTVQRDRARAIELAIANAAAGDVILIAGKGHENYQDIDGQKMAFSDVKQARLALTRRMASKPQGRG